MVELIRERKRAFHDGVVEGQRNEKRKQKEMHPYSIKRDIKRLP
jgi:hypothetical protein